jgi:hypothetical protein
VVVTLFVAGVDGRELDRRGTDEPSRSSLVTIVTS